jgi:serine/threonine protein kinase
VAALLPQPIQFGKYTLFERIGRGGMAEVYKGRIQGPAGFERVFVVKRILPHLSEEPTFIRMFVEEAKLSARLNHPNIVQIFELGSVEGEYFISMEYIRGRDLADTMRAIWKLMGPPRPELVAYVGREACRALAYAHSLTDDNGRPLGMIHRDVSPSNIMLSYEGGVKLLDFGIAKALGEAPETTKSGTMKGKYAYMAPEQTEGDDVDSRIDIFSCGIVLHEVLTGRRLFKGANDIQTIERVRRCEVPPPSFQNPMCPPELDNVVLKALARNRDERFATAAEMADALDDVVHASRFQPGHLAQLLHDLFPLEGVGAPGLPERRPPTQTSTNPSNVTGSGSGVPSAVRSPTIQPIMRSTSLGAGYGEPVDLLRKRRPRFAMIVGVVAVLAIGGFFVWKGTAARSSTEAVHHPVPSDPSRRFNIYVKSEPPGADIFLDGKPKPVGATPISLPIDLNGVSSVQMVLKKPGFEDYQQIITTDSAVSINLQPLEVPAAPAEAPAPPAAVAPEPSSTDEGDSSSKTKRRPSGPVKRSTGGRGKGEIVDPF